MVIFETSIFTLLNDEDYRGLQNVLVEMPGSGNIIQGIGSICKIRWGEVPADAENEAEHG
ncbi:MAG: hypothetical protein ABL882_12100 [Sphingopyxis sp.]